MFGATLANLISGIFGYVIWGVQFVIAANIFCKWAGNQEHELVKLVNQLAERIYVPVRKITSKIPGPFDWAPVVAFLICVAIQRGFVDALLAYARTKGF